MNASAGMSLVVLGSGTTVPSRRRGAPGFLLNAGEDRVVLDTGTGTMSRLLSAGVSHRDVTHLLYTHNHLDHTGELAAWLFTSRVPASARARPLTIGGSSGFMGMLTSLTDLYGPWVAATTYERRLVTLDGAGAAPVAFDGWELRALPVDHIPSSLGYRITDASGKVFVYSGDTDACDNLVELARGADLLLVEASTPDGQKMEKHMTPSEAGEIARRAGARKVVLCHFYPVCDQADMLDQLHRTYDGEAILAEDGMTVTV